MELSILLAKQIVSMFLIVILGYCLVRFDFCENRDVHFLTRLNVNVICPIAIVNSFQIEFSAERLSGLAVAVLAAIVVHILYIVLDLILRKPLHLTRVESAASIYSNSLNLILPLVAATLSQEMTFYTSAFMAVQTFLLWTHGKSLVSNEPGFRLRSMLNPNVIAVIVGLILYLCRITLPGIIGTSVTNVGSMLGPVSMLVIGMVMGKADLKKAFSNARVYLVCLLRLIIYPIATVLVLRYSGLMNLHPQASQIYLVTVLAAASCTASTIPQLAQLYHNEPEYASMINCVDLFLCIVTMPVIVLIYQMLL